MDAWLQTLVLLSAKAGGVILLVMAVRWLLGDHVPAGLRYGLWSLVLLRLALPVFPASSWSLFHLADVDPLAERIPGLAPLTGSGVSLGETSSASEAGSLGSWPLVAMTLWALGVAVLLLRRWRAGARLRARIAGSRPVRDPETLALLQECAEVAGVRQRVEIRQSPDLPGPALVGIRRAVVLLPEGLTRRLGRDELRHVLLHELFHQKRRDPLVRGLARFLGLLHWFNPLIQWGLRRMEADCELACDAAVLRRLQPSERQAYGRTLLFLTTAAKPLPAGLGVGMSTKRQLRRRIEMISRFQAPRFRGLLLGVGVFALLAAVALTDVPALAGPDSSLQEGDEHPVDLDRAKITIERTRQVGSAMIYYLADACPDVRCEGDGCDFDAAWKGESSAVTWGEACNSVTFEELEAKLVPKHLPELPRFDGFGNAFEYCFRPADELCEPKTVLGLRSAGKGGSYEGNTYRVGAFPGDQVERDVVWLDGYFATWPSRPKAEH